MSDHAYYEELAALGAGGHLSQHEDADLRRHLQSCAECRESVRAYRDLIAGGLPVALGEEMPAGSASIDPAMRDRFIARARREGARFSPEVMQPSASPRLSWRVALAGLAAAAAVVLAVLTVSQWPRPDGAAADADRLRQENAQLSERLTARERALADQDAQLRALRTELADAVKPAAAASPANPQAGMQLGRSTSVEARLLQEIQARDRQLADASDEIRRINQLRVVDRSELDAQRGRVREVFDQLRVATATLDVERQLAQAGKDILQLMLARQLRVVDVRDTDGDGRPGAAFARVFVAEGSSIRIFAFDLNDAAGGAPRYQVWGQQVGSGAAARNLGSLAIDDRAQNRWTLSVEGGVVKEINSVYVTAAPRAGGTEGPRMLYAFLGQAASH